MSMKEGFGERDPELVGRQGVVRAAVTTFEQLAWREFGPALVQEGPVPAATAMSSVEASALQQMAADQSVADMAAISTQNMVQVSGAEDVRAA